MRDLWVDSGDGVLLIQTDTLYVRLISKASKNYHTAHSNWTLVFMRKGKYGYAARFFYQFGGTIDEALERAEVILRETYESIDEIL
jgi:hypothetical protein